MSKIAESGGTIVRWSLFVVALPMCGFVSFLGWMGTGFGPLSDSILLLLMLPVLALSFYSFRLAAGGLWLLLVIHLLLPLPFGHLHLNWSDLAPSRIDLFIWIAAIAMGIAAIIPKPRPQKI